MNPIIILDIFTNGFNPEGDAASQLVQVVERGLLNGLGTAWPSMPAPLVLSRLSPLGVKNKEWLDDILLIVQIPKFPGWDEESTQAKVELVQVILATAIEEAFAGQTLGVNLEFVDSFYAGRLILL